MQWGKFKVEVESSTTLDRSIERKNTQPATMGTAMYTASWIGQKKGDVFSQQRFFYQGTKSEVSVDQAHRGYVHVTESDGYQSVNPLFMKYTPDPQGYFYGQTGYGYRSFESFVDCACAVNSKKRPVEEIVKTGELATIQSSSTILTTLILNAGRISLETKRAVQIRYESLINLQDCAPILE